MELQNDRSESCVDPGLVQQAQTIVDAFRRRRLTAVTAESCTGGLIAALLSHAAGAGDCLHGGFVVYTKAHKAAALGVDAALLDRQGSVNPEVAAQLARGALERSPADLALAVTGVVGPEPDEDGNPPGLVYFASARRGGVAGVTEERFREDTPDCVRRAVIERAFALLLQAAGEP